MDILFLDEPTIGLDPAQIVEIRDIIADVGRQRTVLLSTHILAEVEQICNRVIMIIDGQIKADMTMDEIRNLSDSVSITLASPSENCKQRLTEIPGVNDITEISASGRQSGYRTFKIGVDADDATKMQISETAVSNGWGLLEMSLDKVSLESIFLDKLSEAEYGFESSEEE